MELNEERYWKNAKESLPEVGLDVWVCAWNSEGPWYFITKAFVDKNGKWEVDAVCIAQQFLRVTHYAEWLPDLLSYPQEIVKRKKAMLKNS